VSQPGDILTAVSGALDAVTGLNCYPKNPGSVVTPAAVVEIASITSPAVFGAGADYSVRVLLLVQRGEQSNSQTRTHTLIDPVGAASTSAFTALLAYAGAGQVEFDGPGLVEYGGHQYAGGIFTVAVMS
jgi:hypothetical protein